ncbi:hypothetical protein LJB81_01370 [Desulfovibrio sp. OttesenSCG-928-M14]|nr:hypothetical protein [Desulfovibrio sp. OttesenSCG-928-M14]
MHDQQAHLLYVTNTIFTQMGGQRFMRMTGAHSYIRARDEQGDCYLQFKLPGDMCKDGINLVRITLTPLDVYRLTFSKVSHDHNQGLHAETVCEHDFIYADGLEDTLGEVTGLATRLGPVFVNGSAVTGG